MYTLVVISNRSSACYTVVSLPPLSMSSESLPKTCPNFAFTLPSSLSASAFISHLKNLRQTFSASAKSRRSTSLMPSSSSWSSSWVISNRLTYCARSTIRVGTPQISAHFAAWELSERPFATLENGKRMSLEYICLRKGKGNDLPI